MLNPRPRDQIYTAESGDGHPLNREVLKRLRLAVPSSRQTTAPSFNHLHCTWRVRHPPRIHPSANASRTAGRSSNRSTNRVLQLMTGRLTTTFACQRNGRHGRTIKLQPPPHGGARWTNPIQKAVAKMRPGTSPRPRNLQKSAPFETTLTLARALPFSAIYAS